MTPMSSTIASVPSASASYVPRPTPHALLKLNGTWKIRSITPGKSAVKEPRAIHKVTRIVEIQIPGMPQGWRYGRGTCGCEYRSLSTDGKIHRYEISVVVIAMLSTTLNFALSPPLNAARATTQNAVDTIPDRTFTRTGVPRRRLNTPKNGKNAPS